MRSIMLMFSAAILLATAQISLAHDSNKRDVRSELEANNWIVVYGKTVEEGDWAIMAACTYFGCLSSYFDYYLDDTINRIKQRMPGAAREILIQLIENSFKHKGQIFRYMNLEMSAGIATYSRWQRVAYDEPRTYRCKQKLPFGGWTWSICTTTEQVEKTIPLPNHHQPYLRFQFFR